MGSLAVARPTGTEMSAIFISHSSRDGAAAAELKERLAAWGHASIFLDFDPEAGIPPGRDWERELYHQLRTCRAVLVLCSRHSMASHWCFAEITHAKSLGKYVFPLKIADCDVHPVLAGRQVLDLTAGREEAYGRLERALEEALGEGFPWDRSRPPYPGLMAFQEQDAAVFFGRGEEIHAGLESLERLRRYGAGRALMVLGASGSGKSSLVRAGLLPRLARDERRWLVLPPVRPLDRPWRELAAGFTRAFAALGQERGWRELRQELERAARASIPSPEALLAVVRDLRLASGHDEARVLLTLDQAEELLDESTGDVQGRFAALLQAALAAPESPLMAIGTLRTDLMADFQHHPATRDLEFDDLRLGPLTADGLLEIVEGPALVAGVDLEDGLGDAILEEAETEDALPLIAFALRELYERYGDDRRLDLEEYRDGLGGLGGSVAQAAESVLAASPLAAGEEELLRGAMLSLARIDAEGRYARRAVRLKDLPAAVHGRLDAFALARLLVARGTGDERRVEVAHEALFRSWDRLRAWLDEDRELLLWRKRLDAARREWQRTGRHAGALLAGPALEEGRRWLEQRASQLAEEEREFLEASVRRSAARRARRVVAAGLAAALLVVIAASGLWLWQRAEDQRARAEDIARVAVAGELMASDPTRAAQVLLAVGDPDHASFAAQRMRGALSHRLAMRELIGHRGAVTAAAWSPGGDRLLTASADQTARIWQLDGSGAYLELADHGDLVTAAAWSPGGERLLTVTEGGIVRVWPASGAGEPVTLETSPELLAAVFDATGARVLALERTGRALVWRPGVGEPVALGGAERPILRAAFAPAGDRVVTLSGDGTVVSWSSDRPGEGREIHRTGVAPQEAMFDPLGARLLVAGEDRTIRVWRLDGLGETYEIESSGEPLEWARFSPFGARLLTVTEGGSARLWQLGDAAPPQPIEGVPGRIESAVIGSRGQRLALITDSGEAWLWSPASPPEPLRGHAGMVLSAAFSPDGGRLVTASEDGGARIWRLDEPETQAVLRGHDRELVAASFSPGGDQVATASLDGSARIWPLDGAGPPRVLDHGAPIYLVAWDPEGRRVLTVSEDDARLWPAGGEGKLRVFADGDGIEAAALGPRGERIATTSFANEVKVWTASDGQPVTLGSHEQAIVALAFAPGGGRLVSASLDGTARVWNLDGGGGAPVVLEGHEGGVRRAAFSPDGRRLVTGSRDRTARVWDAGGSGEPIVLRGHTGEVAAVSFGPDGRRVATGSDDFEARIWNLEQPEEPIVLARHGERVTAVAFSPDGRHLLSASGDGTAIVWRSDGAGEPLVLDGHDARVTAAAWSPDGATVVTASEDRTARLWLVSATRLQQAIATAVAPCLRPEHRRDYLGENLAQAQRAYDACRRVGAGAE